MNMRPTLRCRIRDEEKRLEAFKHASKILEASALLEVWLYLVKIFSY